MAAIALMVTVFVIKNGENKNTTTMEVKRMLMQINDSEADTHYFIYILF